MQFPEEIIYSVLGFPEPLKIPEWIRNNAKWWAEGNIDDDSFVSGIQHLVKEGIMQIPETPTQLSEQDWTSQEIPAWIKNNADWGS